MSVERSELSVERSGAAGRPVFLSYASQDAEAAKRIADALRAAGVEVWFDQSELAGGDTWDAKIRGQIGSCALFVPLISANTQARLEGYFRIEWKLAARRTHAMATAKAFLLPVVIDDTHDAAAHVPDEFRDVQWTRLKGGETPAAFATRVMELLSKEVGPVSDRPAGSSAPSEAGQSPALPRKRKLWLISISVVLAVAAAVWQQRRNHEPLPVSAPPIVFSASSAELARIRAQLTPDRWQREDFAAMAPTLDRLIETNPELSDAWAMRSIINSLQVLRNFDSSTKPLEVGKAAADRALRLAPGSPLAEIAFGMHLVAMTSRGGDARACRPYLDRGVAALPPDALTRYAELASYWFAYDFDQVQRCAQGWLDTEPRASFPPWIFAQMNAVRRRADEAEKWAEIAVADPNITGVRAFNTMFESKYYLRGDLPAAWATLQRVPAVGRSVHRIVHARWLVALAGHRWDEALQELAYVPETFLFDRSYHGPKALLAGLAHQGAGRADAAAAQFHEAERLLKEHLGSDSDNEELHAVLAVALACAGRAAEARSELALVEPLVKGREPSIYRGSLVMTIAQAHAVLGEAGPLAFWLRKLLAEPSQFPFTPASIRLDARFASMLNAPEIQALLKEFAALDARPENAAPSKPDDKSVAVLAFANLSDDKANEYFSDGISEELLNVLAKVPGLKVSARTSAFHFKGRDTPIPEIAKQLGVAYVIEGSVRKQGDKVRITAQLIKAADGFHVWSDTFTRDLKDIFAVQDEIAGLIAKNLELKIGVVAAARTVDPEAYRLYLEALPEIASRTRAGFDRAEQLITRAIARDPGFVPAQAALAVVWCLREVQNNEIDSRDTPMRQRIVAQAELAVKMGPDWAEAQAACGYVYTVALRFAEGEPLLRRAIQLNPNYAPAYLWLGRNLLGRGYIEEAISALKQAVEIDPLSHRTLDNLAFTLIDAGRNQEALGYVDQALRIRPDSNQAMAVKAQALARMGRLPEALALIDQIKLGVDNIDEYITEVYTRAGRRDKLEPILAATRTDNRIRFILLAALGRNDEALDALDQAIVDWGFMDTFLFNPLVDHLRTHPRFIAKLQSANLTEVHARAQAWRAAHPPERPEAKK